MIFAKGLQNYKKNIITASLSEFQDAFVFEDWLLENNQMVRLDSEQVDYIGAGYLYVSVGTTQYVRTTAVIQPFLL